MRMKLINKGYKMTGEEGKLASQNLIDLSSDVVAKYFPSGEYAHAIIFLIIIFTIECLLF